MRERIPFLVCIMAIACVPVYVLSQDPPLIPLLSSPPSSSQGGGTSIIDTASGGPGVLSAKTYYEYQGHVGDGDWDGDPDDVYAAYYLGDDTWGTCEVNAVGDGGWAWVKHGFTITDSGLGDYDHAKYRFYIDYDDDNTGSKAWAYCRMYLYIWKQVEGGWQYVAGISELYESDYSDWDELDVDYDFQAGYTYKFEMFCYNYAKAYEGGYAWSDTDPHAFDYLRLTG